MAKHNLSLLGLDRGADERAVKRAYAERLRSRRPDDDPAEFQRLHEAYQHALAYVRQRAESRAQGVILKIEATAEHCEARTEYGTFMPTTPPQKVDWNLNRPDADRIPIGFGGEDEATLPPAELVKALLGAGRTPPAEFESWLRSRPELYSIPGRNWLIPLVMEALESSKELPSPECLRILLAFFGLDQVDRRTLELQPRLERLKDLAHRQHQILAGPDMSFMFNEDGSPRVKARSWGSTPLFPAILAVLVLGALSHCVSNIGHRGPAETPPPPVREQEWVPLDGQPKPVPDWRYKPPMELPPTDSPGAGKGDHADPDRPH